MPLSVDEQIRELNLSDWWTTEFSTEERGYLDDVFTGKKTVSVDAAGIPELRTYYPSREALEPLQLRFLNELESAINSGEYPSVAGNISYLFIFAYDAIRAGSKEGYEQTVSGLESLADAYASEPTFAQHCRGWALECLIALGKYDDFLNRTQPTEFLDSPWAGNLRANICYRLAVKPSAVDLVRLFGMNLTGFTRRHVNEFPSFLEQSFDEEAESSGPWLDRILSLQHPAKLYRHSLFAGYPGQKPNLDAYCFYLPYEFANVVQESVRRAENKLRDQMGVPRVGEGWLSETELFRALAEAFPQTKVLHHGRPEWLKPQHLDIWFEDWNIGVEYQGAQHFEPVEIFGGESGFAKTLERDERKRVLCRQNQTTLITVTENVPIGEVVQIIVRSR